ncbi:MAG: adenylate/guanylate cyclase domain-containing protein, partial [Phycisphaerae bacterium]
FIQARRDAMNARLAEAMQAGDLPVSDLRRLLLPKTDPEFFGSPLYRLLDEELKKVQAIRPLTRYMRPLPAGLADLATYSSELAPIREFSLAAAHGGYVDYLQTNDAGAVRAIPLAVNYRGRLFPQMDLVLACAALDVDPRTVKFAPDAVVIPKPPGRDADIRIPVRPVYSPSFGRPVGLFMDVPVRGTPRWEYIFDHKRHQKSELHVSMAAVWDVRLTRERIARNNENLDRALRTLLDDDPPVASPEPPRLGLDAARYKAFVASKPAPEDLAPRLALVARAQELLKETGLDALPTMKDSELPDPRERVKRDEVAAALRGIDRAVPQVRRFEEQLKARRESLKDKIAGRAVLVGWVGTGQLDRVPTAIQPDCPGVVVHGLMFNGIVTGDLWRHAPKWVTLLITLLIGLAVTAANGFLKPVGAAAVAVLLAAAYLLVNGYLLFDYGNLCVGVAGPMVTLGCVWSTGAVAGFLIEAAERARITKRFSSYTDPKLVDYFLNDPAATFKGQVREMSVIFTDLAGFTTLSEKLREQTVDILSEYLGVMVPIIRRHDGFVNKFLGDGIMCFYNAPRDDNDHAAHAVQTCLDMQTAMATFADDLERRGLPRVAMRCGVSTGTMVVGDSGPADASDYTVLGDTVNFASRLEGANKVTGTSVLISQRTVELLGDRYLVRPVGRLQVVGKSEGVMTCEPVAKVDDATAAHRELTAVTAEMVAAYVAADFATCVEVAERMDAEFGPTKLAALYRRTSQQYLATPPGPDFAGNLVLTEK